MNSRRLRTLVQREFHEHRLLWIGPVIAAGLMLIAVVFGRNIQTQGIAFNISMPFDARGYLWVAGSALIGTVSFVGLIGGVLTAFYALDCLFAERRDRSILFWKSLPVSDAETVLSKFIVAVLVVPAGVLLLTLLVQPLIALVLYLRFEPLHPYFNLTLLARWIGLLPYLFALTAFAILWFAPLTTWFLLASVLMRRAPLAFAVSPLLLSALEWLVFHTRHISQFLGDRLFPWPKRLQYLLGPYDATGSLRLEWWRPFQEPALWAGLAVAAGMLYIVIRLRRYRDDT